MTSSMNETFAVGTASSARGQVTRGHIPIGKNYDGSQMGMPVIVAHGASVGPRLWMNAAIHGDEPEGTLALFKLIARINPKKLKGTIVAVPTLNPGAFAAGERGNPADSFTYDMNRIYPGKPDGRLSERIAHAHWSAMQDQVDLQISMHSGGETQFLSHMIFAPNNEGSRELAASMGPRWPLVFTSSVEKGTPNASLTEHSQTPSITIELGGNCRTLTSDLHEIVDEYVESFLNVLCHYGMIEGSASYCQKWHMGRQKALLAPASGIFVGARDLKFEVMMKKGDPIGEIFDLYGDRVTEMVAPEDGLVFGMRSRPSVLAGEWCCFFGIVDKTVDNLHSKSEKSYG